MKVELNASGTLKVSAENELEAYALKKWRKDPCLNITWKLPAKTTGPFQMNPNGPPPPE